MSLVPIHFHPSRFPEAVQLRWRVALEKREMDHGFHYLTHRQAMRWLEVHERYSPARTDPACVKIYQDAYDQAVQVLDHGELAVIGLGCGGGQKEAQLLRTLEQAGRRPLFIACDVSSDLVLTTLGRTSQATRAHQQLPALVADLREGGDLGAVWDRWTGRIPRVFTLFGLLPNFLPGEVLPVIAGWMRPGDILLCSANLAPGEDYQAGCEKILPLYDNALTRTWLSGVLEDLGLAATDFSLECAIADAGSLKRVEVWARFRAKVEIHMDGFTHHYRGGERMRLFYSNRHTPELVREQMAACGLGVGPSWINRSGEEGVWLVRKKFPTGAMAGR